MRPPSMTDTTRLTRSRAISGCQVTSTKWQPNECVEYLGLGLPKAASDFPLPVTRRRLARRSKLSNGTPLSAPSAFTKTWPPSNARSVRGRFSNGEPGVIVAIVSSDAIASSAAAKTAGTTDSVANEPPESGPSGSTVSPSATSTFSIGTPVFCAASCARTVYMPVPMS